PGAPGGRHRDRARGRVRHRSRGARGALGQTVPGAVPAPAAIKGLRRWARESDVGRLTIKKRGVPLDPDRLRRDLRLRGSREVVVVLTPLAGRPVLLEVEPADP